MVLSGDAARAALEQAAAPDAEVRRGVRVRTDDAPPLAARVAAAAEDRHLPWREVAVALDEESLEERTHALSALSPALGADLARWWEWSARQPYQRGWERRSYRSPDPADSLERRWAELVDHLRAAVRHPQPVGWWARWALHLGDHTELGPLLASAAVHGDEDVARVLVECVRGEHEVGGPSRAAFVALLAADDPAGWDEVARLLVAAERAEGLRQTILEAADLAHPDAFARVLDVVVEHRLWRFAGTVRAVGVWVGEELTVRQESEVARVVTTVRDLLRAPAVDASDPVAAFLGLWAVGLRDAHAAIRAAAPLLGSDDERVRLAAARFLTDLKLPAAGEVLARAVPDESLPVYASAVRAWPAHGYVWGEPLPMPDAVRTELRRRVGTLGKERTVETGLLGSVPVKVGGAHAADVLVCHAGDRPLDHEVVAASTSLGRDVAARRWAQDPEAYRAALVPLVADRSSTVRSRVAPALRSLPSITPDEARTLEAALTRAAADLRALALELLQKQEPAAVAASVERLAAGTAAQQRAAEELRGSAVVETDHPDVARIRYRVEDRTPAQRPTAPDPAAWRVHHGACRLAWTSVNAWLSEHADTEVQTPYGVQLLSNLTWLPTYADGRVPLPEVVDPWWERTEPHLTDGGVETMLLALMPQPRAGWARDVARTVVGPVVDDIVNAKAHPLAVQVLRAAARRAWRDSWGAAYVALVEAAAAALPVDALDGPDEVLARRGRSETRDARGDVEALAHAVPDLVDPARLATGDLERLWRALRFVDEPEGTLDRWSPPTVETESSTWWGGPATTETVPDQPFRRPAPVRLVAEAAARGVATRGDVLDALLAPRSVRAFHRHTLSQVSGLRPEPWATVEALRSAVDEVRAAVVATETTRGDLPTDLTPVARDLRSTYGAEVLVRCLAALGARPFSRGYVWSDSREGTLSHLVRVSQPLPTDTADALGRLLRDAKVRERRLVETAVYAPQWARLLEQHLDRPGLESAVWWVHAHTKDQDWTVDHEMRAQWASAVSQRTPLDATDLERGTVDVDWFHEVVGALGEDGFDQVLAAAKYASSSGGHKRAELFARALLGRVTEDELLERITAKRHQDSLRALGLLAVPDDATLLRRYELLRAFVGTDRTSGSQRRASETTAVEVGLANLARTAGYRDPQRLAWAMEAEAVRDLADGPVSASDGDLVVTLAIDADGAPALTVARAGRPLKSVPARSAKVPEVAALRERATALRAQVRRMRASLENACVLGDAFEPGELAELLRHPVLAPMLRDLVLVDVEGVVGFPLDATRLEGPDGSVRQAVGTLRVAHPVDLLASGEWPELQHALMARGRPQAFKQLFRELYTLSTNERDEAGTHSRRYAGHQVERGRASGLFTSRGWVADLEVGFSRTWHQQKVTAWCHVLDGWGTAAEVEDATIEDVTFHAAGSWEPVPLADVPPRVFSETMRDLDLVVSVAHSGGVDPEASESSVEMRARLVDETASLLGLTNVEVGGHHARVRGTLATYSVHLGSGTVHRVPGDTVFLVPVSAQHRGRVFLPFADDDPRTAEVVAKVLLLARDEKITDPTVLRQLVAP